MTVGDLTAAHVGAAVSLEVTVSITQPWDLEPTTTTSTVAGEVVRIQHNTGETLLSLTSWSGRLSPDHPIIIETTEAGA